MTCDSRLMQSRSPLILMLVLSCREGWRLLVSRLQICFDPWIVWKWQESTESGASAVASWTPSSSSTRRSSRRCVHQDRPRGEWQLSVSRWSQQRDASKDWNGVSSKIASEKIPRGIYHDIGLLGKRSPWKVASGEIYFYSHSRSNCCYHIPRHQHRITRWCNLIIII